MKRRNILKRIHSTPERVEEWDRRVNQCLCRRRTSRGTQHGIVHKVVAARKYDGVRALVAWDSLKGGNPVWEYVDVVDLETY